MVLSKNIITKELNEIVDPHICGHLSNFIKIHINSKHSNNPDKIEYEFKMGYIMFKLNITITKNHFVDYSVEYSLYAMELEDYGREDYFINRKSEDHIFKTEASVTDIYNVIWWDMIQFLSEIRTNFFIEHNNGEIKQNYDNKFKLKDTNYTWAQ